MRRWNLRELAPSSRKQTAREPGTDAPRVPRTGPQMPRVLFSSSECRVVVIDLERGDELGEHHVRERATVEVLAGEISIVCGEETVECGTGTLVTFEPGERHLVRARSEARLLLLLAPWPAAGHGAASSKRDRRRLPVNALAEPVETLSADGSLVMSRG